MDFSERLSELRFENEISVEELAKQAGVATSTCYHYLDGTHSPDLKILVNIANYFCCSLDFLVGLTDDTPVIVCSCPPFGTRLKQLMKERGINEAKLHKDLKISRSALYGWFTNAHLPEIPSLIKLAQYFDCSLDHLVGRED